jgi:hypothetical protein
MKKDSFLLGALTSVVLLDKNNQRMFKKVFLGSVVMLSENLGKRSGDVSNEKIPKEQ